jgi:hypothetical protein
MLKSKTFLAIITVLAISGCDDGSSTASNSSGEVPEHLHSFSKTCSIVPGHRNEDGQDFSGFYNIKVDDTVLDGEQGGYRNALDAGKDVARMRHENRCKHGSACSIVPAGTNYNGQEFPGEYSIQIGDTVLNGQNSVYPSAVEAANDLHELQNDGVCETSPQPCSIVPAGKNYAGQEFPGAYNIRIGDNVLNGAQAFYQSASDADKDIALLENNGVCQ